MISLRGFVAVVAFALSLASPVCARASTHFIVVVSDGWNLAHRYTLRPKSPLVHTKEDLIPGDIKPATTEISALVADAMAQLGGGQPGDRMTLLLVGRDNSVIDPPLGCPVELEKSVQDLFSVDDIPSSAGGQIIQRLKSILDDRCRFYRDQIDLYDFKEHLLAAAGILQQRSVADRTILAVVTNKAHAPGGDHLPRLLSRLESWTPGINAKDEVPHIARLYSFSPLKEWKREDNQTIAAEAGRRRDDYPLMLRLWEINPSVELASGVVEVSPGVAAIRQVANNAVMLLIDENHPTVASLVSVPGVTPLQAKFHFGSPGGPSSPPVTIDNPSPEKCPADVCSLSPSGQLEIAPFHSADGRRAAATLYARGTVLTVEITGTFDGGGYLGSRPIRKVTTVPLVAPAPALIVGWKGWTPPWPQDWHELVFFPENRPLTDAWMIRYWQAWGDEFATEPAIASRIATIRNVVSLLPIVGGVLALLVMGGAMLGLFRNKPLKISKNESVAAELNFNDLSSLQGAPLVVARVTLEHGERKPRKVSVEVIANNLIELGVRLSSSEPLFPRNGQERIAKHQKTELADKSEIEICLDSSAIKDIGGPSPTTASRPLTIELTVRIVSEKGEELLVPITATVTAIPAVPLPPSMTYHSPEAPVALQQGPVPAGTVTIASGDNDMFFVIVPRIPISVRSLTEGIPPEALKLALNEVDLPPRGRVSTELIINGTSVPHLDSITFMLTCGGREIGPFTVNVVPPPAVRGGRRVIRDTGFNQPPSVMLNFTPTFVGSPERLLEITAAGNVREGERTHAQKYISLAPLDQKIRPGQNATLVLAKIRLLPADNGDADITAHLDVRMTMAGQAATYLQVKENAPAPLRLSGQGTRPGATQAASLLGANGREWSLDLDQQHLLSVLDVEGPVAVMAELTIQLSYGGRPANAPINLDIPLQLMVLPPDVFLAIDLGTSAIAAAWARIQGDVSTLNLQQLVPGIDENHNYIDLWNSAQLGLGDDIRFLPSHLECNGDQKVSLSVAGAPPHAGYSTYPEETLDIGAPGFVAIPARPNNLASGSKRVIFSLKSWLSIMAQRVRMPEEIRFRHNGQEWNHRDLPTIQLAQSVMSGLLNAFILPQVDRNGIGHLVVTHPNTYTQVQCENLLTAVTAAARSCMGSHWSRRRIHLVSESESVLHAFLADFPQEAIRDNPRQRMMIYDFGAGTIDISIFDIDWNNGIQTPHLLSSVGIQGAGNRIDMLLAGLVDTLLDSDLSSQSGAEYVNRLRSTSSSDTASRIVRSEIMAFHRALVGAKITFTNKWRHNTKPDVWLESSARLVPDFVVNVKNLIKGAGRPRKMDETEFAAHLQAGVTTPDLVWVGDEDCNLIIPHSMIARRMERFTNLVVDKLITAACWDVNGELEDLDKVILSGRGLQWPYILCRLRRVFQHGVLAENLINSRNGGDAKEAVVRGAVRWARSNRAAETLIKPSAQLAIRCHSSPPKIIPHHEWSRPTVLACTHISVVESSFTNVDVERADKPAIELYSPVGPIIDVRHLTNEEVVFHEDENGNVHVVIVATGNTTSLAAFSDNVLDYRPGWPTGDVFLKPEELEE